MIRISKKLAVLAGLVALCASQTVIAAGYSLSVETTNVIPGQPFKIFYTAPAGTPANDWIGIYPESKNPSNYVFRVSTGGAVTGAVTAELVVPQTYIAEYFQRGGFVGMTPPITVQMLPANDAYQVTVVPTNVMQDDLVVVSFSIPTNVNTLNDQLGYYRVSTNPVVSVVQYIVIPPRFYSGSAWFTMFAPPGGYAFQYWKHGPPNATNGVLTPIVVNVEPAPAYLFMDLLSQDAAGLHWQTKTGTVYTVQAIKNFADPGERWQTITSVMGDGQPVLIPVPRTNDAISFRLLER